jgi:hypothetical protein
MRPVNSLAFKPFRQKCRHFAEFAHGRKNQVSAAGKYPKLLSIVTLFERQFKRQVQLRRHLHTPQQGRRLGELVFFLVNGQ